ncbi:MAG: DUF4145 domain-containing protein, partial [Actinomycetota bacterium]|nr:DUF4145 domain-containing protein [Actinomycetota bacterium]
LVDNLVTELGETTGKLDDRIERLARSGDLSKRTVNALDAVRLTGNSAVHAGQIEPAGDDDERVVHLLFTIVNSIVEDTRTLPRQIDELLDDRSRKRGERVDVSATENQS